MNRYNFYRNKELVLENCTKEEAEEWLQFQPEWEIIWMNKGYYFNGYFLYLIQQ